MHPHPHLHRQMGHSGSSLAKENMYINTVEHKETDESVEKDLCQCTQDKFNCHDRPDFNCRNFKLITTYCPILGCLYDDKMPKIRLPTRITQGVIDGNVVKCLHYLRDNYIYHIEHDASDNIVDLLAIVILVTTHFNPQGFKHKSSWKEMVETIDYILAPVSMGKIELTEYIDNSHSEIIANLQHLRSLYAEKIHE